MTEALLSCRNKLLEYTLWYNIIFYLLLFKFYFDRDHAILHSYLIYSIPLFIVGEYIMWFKEYWKKCKYSLGKAVFYSLIGHWLPLITFIILSYDTKDFNYIGLSLGLVLGIVYLLFFNKKSKYIYGVPFKELVTLYCITLVVIYWYYSSA